MAKTTLAKVEPKKRGRQPRNPELPPETKAEKLARLAAARVTAACKRIALVGNLAAYKPTPNDIAAIMEALGQACANVNNRLEGTRKESITFSLHKS